MRGTGLVFGTRGLIVASAQTLTGAERVESYFVDVSYEQAQIIDVDAHSGAALLRVGRPDIPALSLADGRALRQGQLVVTISMLGGQQRTAAIGIVSPIDARVATSRHAVIATDARSGRGFAGGPLVNADSKVVCVHHTIFHKAGQWAGVSFAVAAGDVQGAIARLHSSQ